VNRGIGRRIVGVVAALLVASACNAVSDDFHAATLNSSTWTVENPVGDGSVSVNGHALVLSVPGGTEHDMWSTGLRGLRVVESTPNADFGVESKFESIGAAQFQDEGIVVEQDATTILRFDVYNAGGGQIVLFAASVSGGTAAVKVSTTLTPSPTAPFWMRVKRTGSTWLFTYSRDGINWELGGSFAFAMTVAKVGPYAGNSGTPPPAWTATVDYFFNTATPVVPEDGGAGVTTTIANDDFSAASLNTSRWSFVNPGGGSSQSTDGQHVVINVPSGSSHDPSASGNGAPRIMQTIANANLSVDAKFDSSVTQQFQEQGVVVEQDSTHYVYAAIVQNFFQTAFVVKTVSGATVTTNADVEIYNKPSIILRVARFGSSWTFGYSYDGLRWTAAAATTTTMTVARAGVFGGNFGGASSPAFATKVDYFVNSTSPPATDDGVAWPAAPAAPVINLWYGTNETFGTRGQPQQWVNVLGDVSDPSGIASLTYSLNGGVANILSLGENQVRLVAPGEFNVELDNASLAVGANTVQLTAIDNFGNATTTNVTVNKGNGGPWALPYTATWTPTGGNVNSVAQVADGHWTIQADGTIRNSDIGYDRLVAIGQASTWAQYQGTAQVKINSMDPDGAAIGVIAGFKGATSDLHGLQTIDQPRIGHPFPAAFLYDNDQGAAPKAEIYENSDAHQEQTLIKDTTGLKLTLGTTYTFRFSVTDNAMGGSLYKFKIWKTGTAEPSTWLLQANGDRSRGSIVLAAHRADVNFGTVQISPAP
jgi:regulation of enolase protein 1 (concanavalin A-like superfamily)